jgi:hypothetical protein
VNTYKDLLRAMDQLFEEVNPETSEEVDAYLRKAGYDPRVVGEKYKALALSAIAKANQQEKEVEGMATKEALEKLNQTPTFQGLSRKEVIERIGNFRARGKNTMISQTMASAYRNLDDITDEDLASVLQELTYLISLNDEKGSDEK